MIVKKVDEDFFNIKKITRKKNNLRKNFRRKRGKDLDKIFKIKSQDGLFITIQYDRYDRL